MKYLLSLCMFTLLCAVSPQTVLGITEYTQEQIQDLGISYAEQAALESTARNELEDAGITEDYEGLLVMNDQRKASVVVVGKGPQGAVVLYRITFKSRHRVEISKRLDTGLSSEEAKLWAIKEGAIANIDDPCPGVYRVLTAPDPDGSGYLAFCYREQSDDDVIPTSGFYRMMYSDSGVFEQAERLSDGCVDFHFPPGSKKKNAIRVAYNLSEIPCEAYTFVSAFYNHEIIVYMGSKDIWEIKRGKMKASRMH